MNLEIIYIHVHVSGRAVLFKVKFVDKDKSFYAERPDRKKCIRLIFISYAYPLLTTHICKSGVGEGNKTYNFCSSTCNKACLGYMGIIAIDPFN